MADHATDFRAALDALCQHYGTQLSPIELMTALNNKATAVQIDSIFLQLQTEFAKRVEDDRVAGRLPF